MGYHHANPQDIWVSLTHAPLLATLSPPRSQTPRRQAVRTALLHGTRPGWLNFLAGAMSPLRAVAEIVDKLQAICVVCGGPVSRNQRLVNGRPALWESPTIMVGGRESYEARCRHCHKVPRADEDQTALL